MRQKNREITDFNEKIEVMKKCDVCRLALNDDGYPYIIPLNFGMSVEGKKVTLYFHSALEGYKVDLMKRDNRASFEMDCNHLLQYFEDKGYEVFLINALSGEGLSELMERAYYYVENYEPEPEATDDTVVYEAKQDVEFVITRGDDAAFYITGKRIERLVAMTNLDDDQSLRRFQRIWRFMELDAKLKEKGCKDGDEVVIGDQRFTFQE